MKEHAGEASKKQYCDEESKKAAVDVAKKQQEVFRESYVKQAITEVPKGKGHTAAVKKIQSSAGREKEAVKVDVEECRKLFKLCFDDTPYADILDLA